MSPRTSTILLIAIAILGGYAVASLCSVTLVYALPIPHGQAAAIALVDAPLICPVVTLGAFVCATPGRALAMCAGMCAILLVMVSVGRVMS